MAEEASSSDEPEVEGFPAVPAPASLLPPGEEPTRDIDRCLDMLDRAPIRGFGNEAMQIASSAIADLRAALHPLGNVPETAELEAFSEAIAAFAPDEDAGRRRRTLREWFRKERPPIDGFLDDLEALVKAVPDVSGRLDPAWDRLSTTYVRALARVVELDAFIQAGRIRLSEMTAQIATLPASDGGTSIGEDDTALQLRRKRDAVERRVHLLRIIRRRTGEYLEGIRNAAVVRGSLTDQLKRLRDTALPEWEAALLTVTRAASDKDAGPQRIDFDPVIEANGRLQRAVNSALGSAAELSLACGSAEGTDPGPFEQIEKQVIGPEKREQTS